MKYLFLLIGLLSIVLVIFQPDRRQQPITGMKSNFFSRQPSSNDSIRQEQRPSLFEGQNDFIIFSKEKILTFSEFQQLTTVERQNILQENREKLTQFASHFPNNLVLQNILNPNLKSENQLAEIQQRLINGEEVPAREQQFYYQYKIRQYKGRQQILAHRLKNQNTSTHIRQILQQRIQAMEQGIEKYQQQLGDIRSRLSN